jgi:hypothetical protein
LNDFSSRRPVIGFDVRVARGDDRKAVLIAVIRSKLKGGWSFRKEVASRWGRTEHPRNVGRGEERAALQRELAMQDSSIRPVAAPRNIVRPDAAAIH